MESEVIQQLTSMLLMFGAPRRQMDDAKQQLHLRLLERFGPDYWRTLTSEHLPQALTCLEQARYDIDGRVRRRKHRGGPVEVQREHLNELDGPGNNNHEAEVDERLDLEMALATLSVVERFVFEMLKSGVQQGDIAVKLGISAKRVSAIKQRIIARLSKVLSG